MSIKKQNVKRRMLMVVALAMSVAVLAASTAQADTTLTNQASADSVAVGEPVTFHVTVANDTSDAISPVVTFLRFYPYSAAYPDSAAYEVASATSSQGQCTFIEYGGTSVGCELGTLPPGTSAYMDVVVVPQEPGTLSSFAESRLGVIGQAATSLSPRAETNVTVEPA